MLSKQSKPQDGLDLTEEESESLGVAFAQEPTVVSTDTREHPFHEQFGWSMTEDDVTEALTGEVTPESREAVEDLFADLQEEEADRQAK
jgi:hypothetical protein